LVAVVKVCKQVTGDGVPAVIVVVQNGLPATSCASLKETVPVCGVAVPGNAVVPLSALNVALNVTPWFTVEGLTGEETVVVVDSGRTVCGVFGEVLVRKFESPL
jgi:hypothetical protein